MKSLSARLEKRIKPSREEGLNVMEMVREEEELMSGGNRRCDVRLNDGIVTFSSEREKKQL